MNTDTTPAIITEIVAALDADGWTTPSNWRAVNNYRVDEFGNRVTLNHTGDTVRVEFEYALPGIVETMHLDPGHGAARIAAVISTLAAAPRD